MTAKSTAQRSAEYRARKRGGPPRAPKPCGTYAAARRHERAGESLRAADTVCQPCTAALARHRSEMAKR